jgi:hypothetical protein
MLWTKSISAQSRIDELEGRKLKASAVDSETRGSAKQHAEKDVIDRIYVCSDCHQTFIYKRDVEDHKNTADHHDFREYPLA